MKTLIKILALSMLAAIWLLSCSRSTMQINAEKTDRMPRIRPDIAGTVIPPNIAPLNFTVLEEGGRCIVRLIGDSGDTVTFRSPDSKIRIPGHRWKQLLDNNRGKLLEIKVFSEREDGVWNVFETFPMRVAKEPIDPVLVYREIGPVYMYWNKLRFMERDLESYKTRVVMDNQDLGTTCMHCHEFHKNNPDRMLMHIRSGPGTGMLLVNGKEVRKIDTKTDFNPPTAFPTWHPSGKVIGFSVNRFKQFFHALGENRDVVDLSSDLVVYDIDRNMITTTPLIADPAQMETWPAWSADGKYLYFCRAPQPPDWNLPYPEIAKIKYDLLRIPYNISDGSWGEIEVVLSGEEIGKSLAQPESSPDGKWMLFCLADNGNFTTFRASSDLYMMDIETGEYRKADCNSNQSESHHAWSSNSRWIVFSSKRQDGIHQLPYVSYVDADGNCHKPFILPQEDPDFYITDMTNYHRPELIIKPISISESQFVKTTYAHDKMIPVTLDPAVEIPEQQGKPPEMWMPGKN